MVNKSRSEHSKELGSALLWSAFFSIGLLFFSVFSLVLSGKNVYPWPFHIDWFSQGESVFRFCAGLGMLLLAATPVIMLGMFMVYSMRQRNKRSTLVSLSVMVVVFFGLFMAMNG